MRFRHCISVTAFAVLMLLSADASVQAQPDLIPKPRLKIGVFMPSDGPVKDVSADTWIKIGADIGLPIVGLRAGIDYAFDGSDYAMPITISQIFQPSAVVTKSPVYGGLGIGLWNARVSGASGTAIGLRGIVGVEFAGYLVEANYDIVGKIEGRRMDGLSILVGKKF